MRAPTRPFALAVACIVAAGLAGCGGSGDDDGKPPATTTAASSQKAVGLKFTAQVPDRWGNISDQVDNGGTRYDIAAADTSATGYKSTLLVLRSRAPTYGPRSIADLEAQAYDAAKDDPAVEVTRGPVLRLDGTEARQVLIRRTQQGKRLLGRQVIALHEGELYSIQLVTTVDDPRSEELLRDFAASWRWTG
ncbi:hypothetical protein [Patulibacter minatonensis]|uniref:hypothetical protein n=1 Tax=Patulibacter minatonensis TaxID=298163 RepID=UPI00047BE874|nr:hypothetical protein [Patulibacter minatonensis]